MEGVSPSSSPLQEKQRGGGPKEKERGGGLPEIGVNKSLER
jgi:hypothetical protein